MDTQCTQLQDGMDANPETAISIQVKDEATVTVKDSRLLCRSKEFRDVKQQLLNEIQDVLDLLGWNRVDLANNMELVPSAVTQLLAPGKGIQLTSIVRVASAMNCDVEINLIRRAPKV